MTYRSDRLANVEKGTAISPDGLSIHFDVAGSGDRSLVFVHGWSCDRSYWTEQLTAFSDRYRVVSIDLAGHGDSGVGRRSWTMPAFGGDVAAVLEHLDIGDAVLVGHSMGGDVIVETALLAPDRVRGLVWVDTYRELGDVSSAQEVEAFVALLRGDFATETDRLVRGMFLPTSDPALVARVAADMAAAPPEIAVDEARHSVANDGPILEQLRLLSSLRGRIVAINPADPPTDEASLLRYGVRTVVMPNVGHFPMLEDPKRFDEVLDEVLRAYH